MARGDTGCTPYKAAGDGNELGRSKRRWECLLKGFEGEAEDEVVTVSD